MSIEKFLPDCECFRDEHARLLASRSVVVIAQSMGAMLTESVREMGLCDKSRQYVMEDAILNMVSVVAISDTIIECGSVEAERESLRVLSGMEARLVEKLQLMYATVREMIERGEIARIDGRGNPVGRQPEEKLQ